MKTSRIVKAAAAVAVQPDLVTVPNVELLEAGEDWVTSTGVFTFTTEDLVSCIQSQEDPAIRTPVVKLGHTDPRFDGQPALGRILNLRLTNNNQTLVGDLVAMPLWLAQVMYTAFPRRSIEGMMEFKTRTGNTWGMVLTGVALLGDSYPAIETLEDIQALWGSTPPKLYPVEDVEEIAASAGAFFSARKVDDMPQWLRKKVAAAAPVQASASLDTVRHAYYEQAEGTQAWWWIREVRINPLTLIVDDDEGGLYEVAVNVSGDDEITFGEPVAVKVQYVAASGAPVATAKPGQIIAASHETPEDSGRTSRPDPEEDATLSSEHTIPNLEETTLMLTEAELAALGLPPDATREQISAAILGNQETTPTPEPTTEPETPEPTTPDPETPDPVTPVVPEPETPVVPEGMVLVDAATLEEMRTGLVAATSLKQRQEKQDRDALLDGAIRAGKFPLGRRGHYEKMLCADPVGAKALIATMEPGLVPVTEVGDQGSEVAAAAERNAYPSGWAKSVEAARRGSDRVKVMQD